MKVISVVTPCYNEESNVELLYRAIKDIFDDLKEYSYEHIFIDNSSADKTVPVLKKLAQTDKNLKIIVNIRDFGQNCSPYYALLQTKGDAVILMSSDFQDPPELIKTFLSKWKEGYKIVLAIKAASEENFIMWRIRKLYYFLIDKFSNVPQIKNFTGFGLYDRSFIEIIRGINDPSPYLRGLVADYGTEIARIEFTQPKRKKGRSHNNFYTLFNIAMLGFTSHSIIPLRLSVFIGFSMAMLSLFLGIIYFILKLLFWYSMPLGMAPLVIGFFFFWSIQLFFIGMVGEYIGAIYTQVKRRPLVVEKERINF